MIPFTIIVCTYNSCDRIKDTLKSLSCIEYSKDLLDVVIVDNNSNDDTGKIALKYWNEFNAPYNIKIIYEEKQGLVYARAKGIKSTKKKYVLFCDDDNILQSDYLRVASEVLKKNKNIGVIGGQGIPITKNTVLPNWFFTYASGYATGVQAFNSGIVSERGYVWGAGAIVQRDYLEKLLDNDVKFLLSGRSGELILAGDDSEMCKWFLAGGYDLWYEERMIFWHYITQDRLNKEYLKKMHDGFNESEKYLSEYDYLINLYKIRKKKQSIHKWIKTEIKNIITNNKHRKIIKNNIKKIRNIAMRFDK
jgi:glycosyltransferase involved in cell wall biosynthesis